MAKKEFLSTDDTYGTSERLVGQKKKLSSDRREKNAGPGKIFADDLVIPPSRIYEELGKMVLGQEEAKKSLSVILYQHLKRYSLHREGKRLSKTNALLIGPSGCGKTMLAEALADIAKIPFLKVDATNFVQRGYRGGIHVEQIVDLLLAAAKGLRHRARWAIVFIDELDKIRYFSRDDDDYAGSGVQQDLLSIIDGGKIFYEPDHEEYDREEFDFSNVLFVFAGAFEKLRNRQDIDIKDLVKYGFIPEFANRFGNIIRLEPLSDGVIKKLIRKEVEEYDAYIPMTGSEINVYTEIIHSLIVASKAHEEMGGRCVSPAVKRFFEDRIFNLGLEVH